MPHAHSDQEFGRQGGFWRVSRSAELRIKLSSERRGAPWTGYYAREREVLDLLVQGITSNRELAEKRVVGENTLKYHLRNILDKLHVQNRAQVVAYAVRQGIVEPPQRADHSAPTPVGG